MNKGRDERDEDRLPDGRLTDAAADEMMHRHADMADEHADYGVAGYGMLVGYVD